MATLQDVEPATVERVVEDTSVSDRTRFFAMMGLMLLASLPFLVVHLMNLALQPQYGVLAFFRWCSVGCCGAAVKRCASGFRRRPLAR